MMRDIDLDGLLPILRDAARLIGASTNAAPSELKGDRFNAEVLRDGVSGNPVRRHDRDLPASIEAELFDDFPVLIGVLAGDPGEASIDAQLRRYRNQATIARSWLGVRAPNLHLFLIGPAGASVDSKWRQVAAEIESDDRVCRKLVWLFNENPTVPEARSFLERTFLARPWPLAPSAQRLDEMADVALPPGWEEAILDGQADANWLVDKLIELERTP